MNQQDLIYMQTAEAFAQLSKAQRKKVGAILVTNQGVVIPGVNGTPSGTSNICEDIEYTIGNIANLVTKPEVIHAELNCILKCAKEGVSCLDAVLYTSLSPCLPCSAMLKQAGVKKVYYRDLYRDESGVSFLINNGVSVEKI